MNTVESGQLPWLHVVVVLYKTPAQESTTLRALAMQSERAPNISMTIWDNSPQSVYESATFEGLKGCFQAVEYVHAPENTPLSILYNRVIKANPADIYLLLDQDSDLPATYLETLHETSRSRPDILLFAPKVVANGQIVSPGQFGRIRGKLLSGIEPGLRSAEKATVVTSGLALRRALFFQFDLWFNEKLWLYLIDTDFFLRFRSKIVSYWVLSEEINHGSALREELTLDQQIFRFRNLRWSYLTMMRSQRKAMAPAYGYALAMSLSRAIKQRSATFLFGWNKNR
ncbi:hypothetical protein [Novosphingobium album (ex Liu et al. 2023)]|uniref:Glycosyltransferase n=1 Tax=Novosphingobium album (ex Liu et al. 2023) TaxID=3031130 RepID=A0ABT5WQJ2_9SPHN|nr:hypothetical protein [Novosphingobium album (ex Liu et al. 2023)]MDE8652275.1 hypothetical protein [Novosphingobium album (ex Liu et al. 2023)]